MNAPHLVLVLLMVTCFSLSTYLHGWFSSWAGNRADASNLLGVLMGDSRRMFANHFFVKADVYFHSGYYPSVFDNTEAFQTQHIAEDSGAAEGHNEGDEADFLGKPKDWIDRVNRSFFPSRHTHLDEGGAEGKKSGQEREILPWLAMSAELDPQRVETYVVGSFWLSERLGNVDEAERFLRQGLRANPQSFEILFELGRLYEVHRKDADHARNLWELGLHRWKQQEEKKEKPDYFFYAKFVGYLAELEEREGNLGQAISYWEMLRPHSPDPKNIQHRIGELKEKLSHPKPHQSGFSHEVVKSSHSRLS